MVMEMLRVKRHDWSLTCLECSCIGIYIGLNE
jgi:hypothetical protein